MSLELKVSKKKNWTFGFTLAELLIVVIVLGILAAVALPRLTPQKEKSYANDAVGMLSVIRNAEKAYKLEKGAYLAMSTSATEADWEKLSVGYPNTDYWEYSVTIADAAFVVTAKRKDKNWNGSAAFSSQTITVDQDGCYDGTHPNKPIHCPGDYGYGYGY